MQTSSCTTCGNSHEWHQEYKPRHPFNDGSVPTSATFGRRTPDGGRRTGSGPQRGSEGPQHVDPIAVAPFDPVLRQALIDRGVVTPEDLSQAEDKIRAITAQFHTHAQGETPV